MCYTFLKFSNSARVCERLGQRLCFETSQGICPPTPWQSGSPPPSPGGAEEDMMRRVVRGVHQAHFVDCIELCMVEIKSWLIAPFSTPFIKELRRFFGPHGKI